MRNFFLRQWTGTPIPYINDKDWLKLTRRFDAQYKNWKSKVTTVASTSCGWLNDDSIMGIQIKAKIDGQIYEGIINNISQRKIPVISNHARKKMPDEKSMASLYEIKFDDDDTRLYNIFKLIESQKTTYYRVSLGTGPNETIDLIIPKPCKDSHQKLCLACSTSCVDTIFLNCGHACMCMNCAKRQQQRSGTCPMCRAPIVKIQKMFYVGTDP